MIKKIKNAYIRAKLKDKNYSFLFDENSSGEYIALDTETTGLNPKMDEILSIGAVKIKDNKIITSETFEIFIKPTRPISNNSIKIHHIRECDLENGVDISIAIKKLLYFIGNRTIIGYYISFDFNILNRYIKKEIGTILINDSIELSSYYYKRQKKTSPYEFIDLKFDTIMANLHLPKLGQHDALNDAIMSAMIYLKLKNIPKYSGAYS